MWAKFVRCFHFLVALTLVVAIIAVCLPLFVVGVVVGFLWRVTSEGFEYGDTSAFGIISGGGKWNLPSMSRSVNVQEMPE